MLVATAYKSDSDNDAVPPPAPQQKTPPPTTPPPQHQATPPTPSLVPYTVTPPKTPDKGEEEGDEMFKCPVCLDRLNNPVVTTCGHTFCVSCLERVRTTALEANNTTTCPECKQVVCSFAPNYAVRKYLSHRGYPQEKDTSGINGMRSGQRNSAGRIRERTAPRRLEEELKEENEREEKKKSER
jgi:hypothetical protein